MEADLVLHGGGNTSVKTVMTDLFGERQEALYVKGSGWDLATIETGGFAPLRLDALIRLSQLDVLSDSDMVRSMRAALLDPMAPNPSVEAILHAIIPFRYVDHSHADAVVTLSNTTDGEAAIRSVYGDRLLVVPYVMPGFDLAKKVAALEMAAVGIRVNTVHPNAVFDTGVWTDEVLADRAARYGLTVEEYKTSNLLGAEVRARDVAGMVVAMAGPLFAKTTGAQVPVDGGTERVV